MVLELEVKDEKDITLSFWRENIDLIIKFNKKKLLKKNGNISSMQMKEKIDIIYDKFNKKRKNIELNNANNQDLLELEKEIILSNKN